MKSLVYIPDAMGNPYELWRHTPDGNVYRGRWGDHIIPKGREIKELHPIAEFIYNKYSTKHIVRLYSPHQGDIVGCGVGVSCWIIRGSVVIINNISISLLDENIEERIDSAIRR